MNFGKQRTAISTIAVVVVVVVIIVIAAGVGFLVSSNSKSTTSTSSASSTSSSSASSSSSSPSSSGLILYTADAYVNESTKLASAFTNATGIAFAPPKSAGSSALGQQIAQGDPVSVFISVSKTAIENTTLQSQYSGWAITFATDQMSIAYINSSASSNAAASATINAFNAAVSSNTTQAWYDFYSNLTSGQVKVGISNPNADPAGYRAWIVLEAAGQAYANNASYFVDRMLANTGNVTAASAADLVPSLQSGNIQFLFIYKSDITALGLNYLELPSGVNLGAPSYNDYYSQFTYNTTGGLEKGGTIRLWITVPKDTTNYNESVQFVTFVVLNYKTVLNGFGLVYISPPKLYNDTDADVPTEFNQLLTNGSLVYDEAL